MRSSSSPLPASFWRMAALTTAWWALPLGVFAFTQGQITWGLLFTIAGIAALVFVLSGPAVRWAQARRRSPSLAGILVVFYFLVALVELWQGLQSFSLYTIPSTPAAVHALILAALAALTGWQIIRPRPS